MLIVILCAVGLYAMSFLSHRLTDFLSLFPISVNEFILLIFGLKGYFTKMLLKFFDL
jgi:hypothetical protein